MRILALLVVALGACGSGEDDVVECDPMGTLPGLCEPPCTLRDSGSTPLPEAPSCVGHSDVGVSGMTSFVCEEGSVIENDGRIGCCFSDSEAEPVRFFEC